MNISNTINTSQLAKENCHIHTRNHYYFAALINCLHALSLGYKGHFSH